MSTTAHVIFTYFLLIVYLYSAWELPWPSALSFFTFLVLSRSIRGGVVLVSPRLKLPHLVGVTYGTYIAIVFVFVGLAGESIGKIGVGDLAFMAFFVGIIGYVFESRAASFGKTFVEAEVDELLGKISAPPAGLGGRGALPGSDDPFQQFHEPDDKAGPDQPGVQEDEPVLPPPLCKQPGVIGDSVTEEATSYEAPRASGTAIEDERPEVAFPAIKSTEITGDSSADRSVEQRLRQLHKIYSEGLIDENDFEAKKRQLLSEL